MHAMKNAKSDFSKKDKKRKWKNHAKEITNKENN